MPWTFKNTGEVWTGDVHKIGDRVYSGLTRTSESRPLVWAEETQRARTPKGAYKADDPSTPKVDESKVAKKPRAKKGSK